MSGAYGDFLGAFGELFQPITFYSMDKEINGSLTNSTVVCTVPTIVLDDDNNGLWRQSLTGMGKEFLNCVEDTLIYVLTPTSVKAGLYFRHPVTKLTMRVTNPLDRALSGGLIAFKTESLTGTTDQNNQTLTMQEALY